ncbi:GGDEF domain-containing protein [Legionella pneumophila]|uniref:Sensory box protein, EAL domain, GGDEF domain, signal transduction protein n=1 Tax=Legionella pneumophila subsp. pascullei TaxID=91890 RepID=A0AAX2J022_LEGPN|nr:GGDEF domain-containing protein [Legionella pneumophila]AMP88791.1 GGDEF domain-containing protein [Legionella pneumophila subsp. pascullei]AMP93592.1 histidine kinase [Legionella pneumophila subsp. pascullei]AMP96510.1 histidine kinase [Legionella pneumophila subsp. pascullei]SQG91543.1 sensory box protein, EAL domain, GGDEF domain, signal transduction protein [Legionella pneumophila subsp. pascullei]VEH08089.1 sensory box protein, EAL domain, GGDEF domain, signal transduction protein [Leg
MSLLKKTKERDYSILVTTQDQQRKRHLISTISIELIILGILLLITNFYLLRVWLIISMLITGILILLGNLILIKKNYNLTFCGHILNILVLSIIIGGNLIVGNNTMSYLGWFYVSPIIAFATLGLNGLIIYGLLAICAMILFVFEFYIPIYSISQEYLFLLDNTNHLFIFALIFTVLYHFLIQNSQYELLLKEQNYLLIADKEKFHYLSHHDSLTNLPNRSYFHAHLQTLLENTDTKKEAITLYFMDLDKFKPINDEYGHEFGDHLLLLTSKRLQSCFRKNDFIARLGGDEFTAIIVHKPHDQIAEALTLRVEQEFKQPFLINGQTVHCSISVGLANYPHNANNAEDLLKCADKAMYDNKKKKYQTLKQTT